MKEALNIRESVNIIKKYCWLISLITLISVVGSSLINLFMIDPTYQANSSIYVNKDMNTDKLVVNSDDVLTNTKLATVFSEIIKSRKVLSNVIQNLSLDMSEEQLGNMIKVTKVKETQLINISVQNNNNYTARRIANAIAESAVVEINKLTKVDSVQIIDYAILPQKPIKPNIALNISVTGVAAAMFSLVIVFVINDYKKSE